MLVHGVELIEEGDMVCRDFKRNEAFEDLSISKWLDYLDEDKLAIDVGSYSGLYAILAAKVCRTIAVEPNPIMASRISQNAALNGVSVEVLNVAAGASPGRCSLKMSFPTSSATTVVEGSQIEVIPLRYENVCAVKIDVEGMELDVLKGMKELPPLIIAEALSDRAERDLIDYLETYKVTKDGRNLIFECDLRSKVWG